MSKIFSFIYLFSFSFIFSILLYLGDFSILLSIEDKISDLLISKKTSSRPYKSENVVIIKIDEKSLQELGGWPWSRKKISQIIENLNDAKVAIIGLDMTFGEEDGKSPSIILMNNKKFSNLEDYDDILSQSFLNAPVITGLMMYFDGKQAKSYQYKNHPFKPTTAFNKIDNSLIINTQGIISNIPKLQNSGYSTGFLNTLPDNDGIIRYTPLIMSNENYIVPSITLEISRLVLDVDAIKINSDKSQINSISLNNKNIPTDYLGRFHINFKGGIDSFEYISAYDIYMNNFDKSKINSKIVLMGATAIGLSDNKATPIGIIPGVQVHANMIDNILTNDYIHKLDNTFFDIFVMFFLLLLIALFNLIKKISIIILLNVSIIISYIAISYFYFLESNILVSIIFPVLSWFISIIVFFSYRIFAEQKQKKKISSLFSKKVSKKVMESLLEDTSNIQIANSRETSIFFSDIRGFTPISEKLSPIELIAFLNEYMTPMADIIDERYGTIDKFIGDAIMAYWNAPFEIKNHADYAVESAIEQIKYLRNMQQDIKDKYNVFLDIGIGINTGDVIAGEIGSTGRSDYTVIGDAVNLASRVESLNKGYGTNIIITEFTKNKLTKEYNLKFLDSVIVKGKSKGVNIYEVIV